MAARRSYDRKRILEAAARATARRRRHEAIRCYRRVLVAEPGNAEIHRRIAPLLAVTGQRFDAWLSFRMAARSLLRQGHEERALALYREAAQRLPRNVEAWSTLARLEIKRGQPSRAFDTLLQGSRKLRRAADRSRAIHLLRQALVLEPRHVQATLELARLMHRSRAAADRRRACAALLALFPSLRHGWMWLRSLPGSRTLRPADGGVAVGGEARPALGRVAPAG
jgi:tetratricopeptide (TPR) repeat protein